MYSIQHYVIKFVSDMWQFGGWFSQGTQVSFTNKSDRHHKTEILLKAGVKHHNTNPSGSATV
jgi:hypothetical protein